MKKKTISLDGYKSKEKFYTLYNYFIFILLNMMGYIYNY